MACSRYAHQVLSWLSGAFLLTGLLFPSVRLAVSHAAVASAITADGTLGTRVTQSGTAFTIGGGTITGNNQFHSFGRFSVGTGDRATFTGPPAIANIVSRVTGGQQSVIDGLLRSQITGANLYLLNSSGVLFGPNARLDVSGSFHVSTADYLRFTDGAKFQANLGQESVLSVAPPAAFGFLGNNPAPIAIQGSTLQVAGGKALSVVGGDVQMVGGILRAPSGRLQLASLAAPGEVLFSRLEMAPALQVDSFARLGRLELSQDARLDVSGERGGTVLIRGGRLLGDRSSILANTMGDVDGASQGVDLRIAGEALITNGALIQAMARRGGNAGDIIVEAGTLSLIDGGRIDSSTQGAGQGGRVTVHAEGTVTLAGRGQGERGGGQGQGQGQGRQASGIFSDTRGSGDAGNISVSAATLELNDGRISAFTFAGGNGGNIDLQVGRLTLTAGSQIGSRADHIGQGGHVTVTAREIVLDADSEISARSQSESLRQFFSADPDVGKSGTITLTVDDTIHLQNGGRITVETAQANAGSIALRSGSLLDLRNGSTITTSAAGGQGNGGDITIASDTIVLQDGQIRAEAFAGRGGNILITAEAFLADPVSRVSASSALGLSGTVNIRAPATSVTGSLIPLPQDFLQVAALLPEPCAARMQSGKSSSLVLRGRDGLPLEPGGLLPSPFDMDERLMAGPAVSGGPARQRPPTRLTLLDGDDKVLPRMASANQQGLSRTALNLGCSK